MITNRMKKTNNIYIIIIQFVVGSNRAISTLLLALGGECVAIALLESHPFIVPDIEYIFFVEGVTEGFESV